MATGTVVDVVMPQMGVSVSEGTVSQWLKQVGDSIERDETILEISTDKVDTEVPSPADGIVTAIFVEEGDTVDVGVKLAEITVGGEAGGAAEAAPVTPAAPAQAAPAAPAPVQVAPAPAAPAPAVASVQTPRAQRQRQRQWPRDCAWRGHTWPLRFTGRLAHCCRARH